MLPSVARESIALLPLSSRSHDVSLTPDAVMKQTYLRQKGNVVYRQMSDMFWSEHEDISSLRSRVSYINSVLNHIQQLSNKDRAITLISFGSGGLLMESFIHRQLQHLGYRDISWRVIDIDYGDYHHRHNHAYDLSLDAFSKITSGHLSVYRSEQNYFNSSYGGSSAVDDRSRGITVLLAIDPPTTPSQILGTACVDPARMSVKGRPVEDITDANCFYVIASDPEMQNQVQEAITSLAQGDKVVTLGSIIKCHVNKFGHCEVLSTQSERSLAMAEGCKQLLEQAKATQASTSKSEMTLSDIKRTVDHYLATRAEKSLYYSACCVSDYDISLARLRGHIMDNHHSSLFAGLELNHTHIEKYP